MSLNNSTDIIINLNTNNLDKLTSSLSTLSPTTDSISVTSIPEEPIFKYQRLGSSLIDILKYDSATSFIANNKLLALGTLKGFVHILDFAGNEIKRFAIHNSRVNDISFDNNGDWIVTCSDDGNVIVLNLYEPLSRTLKYNKPIKTVQLQSNKEKEQNVILGGLNNQLIYNIKGWFSYNDQVIHGGEGPVYCVKWRGSLIAWANDVGVKIYDFVSNERLSFIDRPKGSPPADKYKCSLLWTSDNTLLIAWADSIKVAVVRPADEENTDFDDMASISAAVGGGVGAHKVQKRRKPRTVEIVSMIKTDCNIAGIAEYKNDILLLAIPELPTTTLSPRVLANRDSNDLNADNKDREALEDYTPELRMITILNQEVFVDALPITGWEFYKCNDYSLVPLCTSTECLFYIVSPNDIVVAKPRDCDDHISWLLQYELYADALKLTEENANILRLHKILDVGEKYLRHLLEEKEFDQAAKICQKLLGQNVQLWETWIFMFSKIGQLNSIIPVVPISNPQLNFSVYELILKHYIINDHEIAIETLKKWPNNVNLYRLDVITAFVIDTLDKSFNNRLMLVLAYLFEIGKQYDKALNVYLKLKEGNIFELITNNNLFDAVKDKIYSLWQFNATKAIQMLVANTSKIPIRDVVYQLTEHPKMQHEYLNALFHKDSSIGSDFHDLQVKLYAEYEPQLLLLFLKQSNYYKLEKALEICKSKNLYREEIFIYGRIGNTSVALGMIINKLNDVKQAIDFISEHDGGDILLWQELTDLCLKDAKLLSDLLEFAPQYLEQIKPRDLISKIEILDAIPNVNNKILQLLSTYSLEIALRDGCNNILKKDCVALMNKLHKFRSRGIQLCAIRNSKESSLCSSCENPIYQSRMEDLSIYFCGHTFHKQCIESYFKISNINMKEYCFICNRQNIKKMNSNNNNKK